MKKMLLGMLLASCSLTTMAAETEQGNRWVGGIGYANLSEDLDGVDISLGGIVASLGYQVKSRDNFFITPEIRFGTGVSDDTVSVYGYSFGVELERFVALSVRGQFEFDNGFYLYAAPTYANAKFKVSGLGTSASDDSWEFGVGGGLGYNFTQTVSAEVSYEQFDGTDVVSIGLKFGF